MYFNYKQLANTLGIGVKTAYALMRTEGFPSFKVGGKWLVEEESLKSYFANNKVTKPDYRGLSKPLGDKNKEGVA